MDLRSRSSSLLAVASTLAVVSSACATLRPAGELEPRYVAVHNTLAAMGLAQVGPLQQGSLAEGREARLSFELAAQCTTLVALGTNGVRDLDVTLLDPAGKPLAHDTTHEPQAIVRACVENAGAYTLVVKMAQGAGDFLAASWTGGVGGPGGPGGAAGGGGGLLATAGAGTCDSPIPITAGTINGSTTRGESDNEPSGSGCSNGASSKELVYRFEVTQKQRAVVDVEPHFDSVVYLRKDDCADPDAEIACNDDAPRAHGSPSPSRLDEVLEPGTYYLFVDGYRDDAGSFRMTLSLTDVPSLAEVCRGARALVAGSPTSGSTSNAYDHAETTSCGEGAKGPDTVYKLDLAQRSRVRLLQHSDDFAPVLHLRKQCADEQSEVACVDSGAADGDATFVGVLDPGSYAVFADANDHDADGRYTLAAETAPEQGTGVSGDGCGDAVVLSRDEPSVTGDTFLAKDDVAGRCGGAGVGDVVYRVEVPKRSRVTAHMTQEEGGKHVFVLQKTCADKSTELACGDAIDQVLAAGTYFLAVDGNGAEGLGKFDFQWSMHDVASLEAACRTAPLLVDGKTVTGNTATTSDKFQPSCVHDSAGDRVHKIVLAQKSHVRITLTARGWEGALSLRSACDQPVKARAGTDAEIQCSADTPTRIDTTLDAGTYWVVVDGRAVDAEGPYSLEYTVLK